MDFVALILGNLFSLLAMFTDSWSASQKTAKKVLEVQLLSQFSYGASSFVLGGYSAVAQNVVSALRNLAAIRNIRNAALEWILVGTGVVLGLAFNNLGFMGLLPVIASTQYSLAIFRFRDNERALKISFMISCVLFTVFNLVILNIVGVVTNTVITISTSVNLWKTGKA